VGGVACADQRHNASLLLVAGQATRFLNAKMTHCDAAICRKPRNIRAFRNFLDAKLFDF
jgi:hypothetical protein